MNIEWTGTEIELRGKSFTWGGFTYTLPVDLGVGNVFSFNNDEFKIRVTADPLTLMGVNVNNLTNDDLIHYFESSGLARNEVLKRFMGGL